MNIYDLIKDAKIDIDALEKLKETVRFDKIKRNQDIFLCFDNGIVYAVGMNDGEVTDYQLLDNDGCMAFF